MANVVVVGAQWGDEGKGKIVDYLADRADIVVRFQGGHNAGHSLVIDGVTYKLSLLPSGVVRGKLSLIGNGVVIDPYHLKAEIAKLREMKIDITPENLHIAENASLILSLHRELDEIRENAQGNTKIGTTKRGIGPAYEDKIARRAIFVADLYHEATLRDKIVNLLNHHNALRRGLNLPEISVEQIYNELMEISHEILPFSARIWQILAEKQAKNSNILFEGAQGSLLDNDFGTYPFVTSSNTVAAQAAIGTGVGPKDVGYILGIVKAYTTRVGEGPFPTEQQNDIGEYLGVKGHEFGVVTGRKRRCGWFDAVALRQMVQINGINGIALTKLDVLDNIAELKICVAYELDGKVIDYLPRNTEEISRLKPIYKSFAPWQQNIAGIRHIKDLPKEAREYIGYIEEVIGVKIILISTSPEREDIISLQCPFNITA